MTHIKNLIFESYRLIKKYLQFDVIFKNQTK